MATGPITSWQIDGEKVETDISFSCAPKLLQMVPAATKLKDACSLEEKWEWTLLCIKKQSITLLTKVWTIKATVFPVVKYGLWQLDHREGWAPKNWCFQTVVLENTFESSSDSKEIKPVNPKGNQPWIFIGRTDAEAKAPILWPPDVKSWLTGKDPDSGKDWRQEEKGITEDEMVGWHQLRDRHEFKQTLGDGEGQGSLVCYSPWGHKKLDTT